MTDEPEVKPYGFGAAPDDRPAPPGQRCTCSLGLFPHSHVAGGDPREIISLAGDVLSAPWPKLYTCLAELPDRRGLLKFERHDNELLGRHTGAGTRVWVSPRHFGDNCRPEYWRPYLREVRPDLCVESDTRMWRSDWLQAEVFPALLALARDPLEGGPEAGLAGESQMAKKKEKAAATNGHGGRKPKVDPKGKITVLAEKNPKREGTKAHGAFALYRTGMLVSTFLEKGGRAADLSYDLKHGYIQVDAPAA